MQAAEYLLIAYGIDGRPLCDVPAHVAKNLAASGLAELTAVSDLPLLRQDYLRTDVENCLDTRSIEDVAERSNFVLRLKAPEWRRLVLRNKLRNMAYYFSITSYLITRQRRATLKDICAHCSVSAKTAQRAIKKLLEDKTLICEAQDGAAVYFYNTAIVGSPEATQGPQIHECTPSAAEKQKAVRIARVDKEPKNGSTSVSGGGLPSREPEKRGVEAQAGVQGTPSKRPKSLSGARLEEAAEAGWKALLASADGLTLSALCAASGLSYEEAERLVKLLQKNHPISVSAEGGGARRVRAITHSKEQQQELLRAYIDDKKIIVLSDARGDLQRISPLAFRKGAAALFGFFEASGFNTVELRSRYVPSQFLVAHPCVTKKDPEFIAALRLAEARMAADFSRKIEKCFFKTPALLCYDNGFEPDIGRRVRILYDFLGGELRANGFQLLFDDETLHRMEFLSYCACVPLQREALLVEAALCYAAHCGASKADFDCAAAKAFLDGSGAVAAEMLLESCRALLRGATCGLILQCAGARTALAEYLKQSVAIAQLGLLLSVFVTCGIFELYSTSGLLFFRTVDGMDQKVGSVCDTIDPGVEQTSWPPLVPLADRKALFDKLHQLPQEAFSQRAKKVINTVHDQATRAYLLKRLAAFNK
ncbi:hypothetical protein PAPHI01_0703 [Pancytospora philotis]|nr:hypothetical protein PAPHI01_0703 [Pancytospora philotis]